MTVEDDGAALRSWFDPFSDVPDRMNCQDFCAERAARLGCTDPQCMEMCAPEIQQAFAEVGCLEIAEETYACILRNAHSCGDGCGEWPLVEDYSECAAAVVDILEMSSSASSGAGGGL